MSSSQSSGTFRIPSGSAICWSSSASRLDEDAGGFPLGRGISLGSSGDWATNPSVSVGVVAVVLETLLGWGAEGSGLGSRFFGVTFFLGGVILT